MLPDDDALGSLLDEGEPGADLLDEITTFLRRFVVFPNNAQVAAIALWIVHTHAFDAAEVIPYLAITSAEKRSGKTRTLDILELLAAEPWRTINPTGANLFRSIAADRPTLLLDEVDAVFGSSAQTRQEGTRAVLNEGYKRGASVRRLERGIGWSAGPCRLPPFSARRRSLGSVPRCRTRLLTGPSRSDSNVERQPRLSNSSGVGS